MTENSQGYNGGEVQHYVPQFILRKFTEKKNRIYVFDKWKDKVFLSNIRNVACERSFNDVVFEGYTFTTEKYLSRLESESAEIIADIVKSESLACLDDKSKLKLSEFFAVQFVRTKKFREMFKSVGEQIADFSISQGVPASVVEGWKHKDEELPLEYLRFLIDADEYRPHFYSKQWVLFKSGVNTNFWISDNPVVLHNDQDYGLVSGLGLAVKGVQIFFPISRKYIICMLCRSIFDDLRSDYGRLSGNFDWNVSGKIKRLAERERLKRVLDMANGNSIFLMSPDKVDFCNDLQISFSHRYVYSFSENFSFIRRVVKDCSYLQNGLQIKAR